jgi:hypothetical protein
MWTKAGIRGRREINKVQRGMKKRGGIYRRGKGRGRGELGD